VTLADADPPLRALALRLLARRECTRAELQRKLAAHGEAADVEALLDDLERLELLSDARAVESFVRANRGRYGSFRLRHALRERGVAQTLIDAALAGCRDDELERAHAVWSARFGERPGSPADYLKQQRFLQARGFAPDLLKKVLRRIDEDEHR
jgi:regulatory protein